MKLYSVFTTVNFVAKMNLSGEDTILLIKKYEEQNILWNPKHPEYYNRKLKKAAWEKIAETFQKNVGDVKQKMASLLASFRREKKRVMDSHRGGTGNSFYTNKIYFICILNQIDS